MNNAIELAVNEAIRTGSLEWFDMIISYVEKGVTRNHAPSYFSHAVHFLFSLDQRKFEQLISTLWDSYNNEEIYFTWIREMNHLLLSLDIHRDDNLAELSGLHKEAFFSFIDGRYFIKISKILFQTFLRIGRVLLTLRMSSFLAADCSFLE